MNQQLKDFGKSKNIPVNVLKWVWQNIDRIEDFIQLLKYIRDTFKGKNENRSSCQTPRPAPKFEPGYWACTGGEWVWVPQV
jgi:predicted transcriptional regulator